MDYEILGEGGSGDDDDDGGEQATASPSGPTPRRGGRVIGAVLALAALVALLLAFGPPGDWSATAPPASPSPSAPSPSSAAAPSTGSDFFVGRSDTTAPPMNEVSLGTICTPRTEGKKLLTVSFEVINTGRDPARLLEARPLLPLRGYLKLVRTRAGGDCRRPAGQRAPGRLLASGEVLLVTWTFRLLRTCPGAAPVEVQLRVAFGTGPVKLTSPLLADLGEVRFAGCRSRAVR